MAPSRGRRAHREPALRRRAALLRAAIELIGERGVGAVTHRAVAARAGVPASNTTYFFNSIDELIEEALRSWVHNRCTQLEELAARMENEHATPAQIADAFTSLLFSDFDDSAELTQYEAYLQAARNPALREAVAQAQTSFENAATAALRAAGAPDPRRGARAFTALTDGFVLNYLANPRPGTAAAYRQAVRDLFIAYAMPEDERTAWDARLDGRPPRQGGSDLSV